MKKTKIIGTLIIIVLSVISHFIYDWFPYTILSIFFPVNESIWEHMKLISTPTLIFYIFEVIYYKKNKINTNNLLLSYLISIIICIPLYLIIYLPIDSITGYNSFIAITLLFIIFALIEIISYYIEKISKDKKLIDGVPILIIIYSIFTYLTFYPIKNYLFYDKVTRTYGINNNYLVRHKD